MVARTRDEKMTVFFNEDEMRMLQALAAEEVVSASHVIRQLIRREFAAKYGGKEVAVAAGRKKKSTRK